MAARGKWSSGWGAFVLSVGLLMSASAFAQTSGPFVSVRTRPLEGSAGDSVVASLVETGVRTNASVLVTVRLVDSAGAVLAESSGWVSASTPLRLRHRAATADGVRAQVFVPVGTIQLAAPVLTFERWSGPGTLTSPHRVCPVPTREETGGTPEPVTDCEYWQLAFTI
ncbi:hypothetical protein JGU66_10575 [Myxococcaceae bacterium JPH2]|nr:hypothetical protein [Myxococcaceae bacterium JPH2]